MIYNLTVKAALSKPNRFDAFRNQVVPLDYIFTEGKYFHRR
jgi:hypothetical protein